jgi:hypothetical protein
MELCSHTHCRIYQGMKKKLVTSKTEVTIDMNKTPTLSSTEIAAI